MMNSDNEQIETIMSSDNDISVEYQQSNTSHHEKKIKDGLQKLNEYSQAPANDNNQFNQQNVDSKKNDQPSKTSKIKNAKSLVGVTQVKFRTEKSELKLIKSNQNSQSIALIPPSIQIMNEFGQHTGSIVIANNNIGNQLTDNEKTAAVLVKNVYFAYSKNDILSDISLCVPKGKIYALLGSSGCGKTTLLRTILGQIKPRKGLVRVLGERSKIPGSEVGYMPQELALFGHFTIEETCQYYGMLHHMSKKDITAKIDFLVKLLNLPAKERRIDQCSGGQQRRASIAVTLFHDPQLLILDEPTVGVDPLLRCKIWEYLHYLCISNGMTVIITTHYIEESRNAANLAFMRFGRILAQDSPDALLQAHQCSILEDVFLKLCQQDCGKIKKRLSAKNKSYQNRNALYGSEDENEEKKLHKDSCLDGMRLRALFFKNGINIKRNPIVLFFSLFLPVIQILLFCYSVYKMPENLSISVYNGEREGLSKKFLNTLNTQILNVNYFGSQEEAVQSVVDGNAWYAISINANFTKAYNRRVKNPSDLRERLFETSKIKLYVDHSDSFLYIHIYNSLLSSYQLFLEEVAQSFGFSRSSVRLPIHIDELVYGSYNSRAGFDLLEILTPGTLVAIIYTTPLIMSAFSVVLERKGNIIERTLVSGAKPFEVFVSLLVSLMAALSIQVALLMAVVITIFEIRILGSLFEMYAMLYLQGLCGVLLGLLVSSISKNEIVALLLSFALVFPIWMMCGVFWPLESVISWMQNIFWCMPLSMPIRSIELIVKRGWSFDRLDVQIGYYVSFIYNGVLLIINIVIFQITSK